MPIPESETISYDYKRMFTKSLFSPFEPRCFVADEGLVLTAVGVGFSGCGFRCLGFGA